MNANATDGVRPQDPRAALYATEDFIAELFYRVDAALADVARHPLAKLWPGEVVTLAMLYALKGRGERAFYRWADRDLRPRPAAAVPTVARPHAAVPAVRRPPRLVPAVPGGRDVLRRRRGVADSFGVEMLNTLRCGAAAGRSAAAASAPAAGWPA